MEINSYSLVMWALRLDVLKNLVVVFYVIIFFHWPIWENNKKQQENKNKTYLALD